MFQAFVLVDSAGSSAVEQGRNHMVTGDILDANTLAFDRVGTSGQAEISYALVECFNNELNVQSGEILLASGTASATATIPAVDPSRSIVLVSTRTDVASAQQHQAHATGELVNGTTVQVRRAAAATSANTFVRYQIVEFSISSGASVQTGEVAFNGGQSIVATLGTAVDMNSSWLNFSYDASSDGPQQTAIKGQMTAMNQITFTRHATNSYNNRIRYYVVTFPTGDVTVRRGASSYTGGSATATHNIGFSGVSALTKAFTFVTNTTADTGGTGGTPTVKTYYGDIDNPGINVGTNGTTNITTTGSSLTPGVNSNRIYGGHTSVPTSTTRTRIRSSSTGTQTKEEYFRSYTPQYAQATTISAGATVHADVYMSTTGTSCSVVVDLYEYNDTTGIVGAAKGTVTQSVNAGTSSVQSVNAAFNNAQFTVAAGNRLLAIYYLTYNNVRPAYLVAGATSSTPSGYNSITVTETAGSSNTYPRNRWTERLSSATNIQLSNWRGDTTGANANFDWQVVEFTGTTPVYGDGSDLKVDRHFSTKYTDPTTGQPLNLNCIECHNPMSSQSNLKLVRSTIRNRNVVFTAYTGVGSFADGGAVRDGICEVCHTQTNHHQADGTAPGGQSHNDGTDCRTCHAHLNGYQPVIDVPAPHNAQACNTCHTAEPNYATPIANTACLSCHDGTGSTLVVDRHFSTKYNDPTTGAPMDLTCVECHNPMFVQTNFRGNTNLAFIRSTIRGNQVAFEAYTGQYSFASDNNKPVDMLTQNYVCNTCHTQTLYHQADGTAPGGQSHNDGVDCAQCHQHNKGFQPGGCTSCHAVEQNGRAAAAAQFNANSHHVQGVAIDETHCYQCHWEANSDGSINATYHGGPAAPGSAVNLVIYGSTARPTTYTVGSTAMEYSVSLQTRAELTKINSHCLGCHDADSGTAQPFGDGKTPKQYAWDARSIAERYSQTGTTTWGKYVGETNAAQKNIVKAYSAHGNAAANAQGWSATTGVDGTIPNRTGGINVLCIDCHNSHGSNASGTTTYYMSQLTNGGILKDVTAGVGGSTATYKPSDFPGTTTMTAHSAGSALCFNCHMTPTANAATPWGYQTFGATDMIISYLEKVGWEGGVGINNSGPQRRYPYKANLDSLGGHFGASSPLSTTPADTIDGLCSACHDPHGVSPSLGTNQQYAVPLLKGTWLTSPYMEDAAATPTNQPRGGGRNHATQNIGSTPGYHIDQNTFRSATNATLQTYTRYNVGAAGAGDRIMQTAAEFGGLCLSCHSKAQIDPDTNNTWGTYDRIHDSVLGWASTTGNNANNTMHGYSCSKCHTPHSSCLPRLTISNCLDVSHRNRVVSGGNFSSHSFDRAGDGGGQGRGPAGGGGWGSQPNQWGNNSGAAYLWGTAGTSGTHRPAYPTCHDTATGAPTNQLWNNVTPW